MYEIHLRSRRKIIIKNTTRSKQNRKFCVMKFVDEEKIHFSFFHLQQQQQQQQKQTRI